MALEDLNPAVRVEEILDGADIEPATRLEYFMKKAANEVPKPAGSSDAGKVVTVNEDGDGFILDEVDPGLPEITGVSDAGKVVSVNAAGSAYELTTPSGGGSSVNSITILNNRGVVSSDATYSDILALFSDPDEEISVKIVNPLSEVSQRVYNISLGANKIEFWCMSYHASGAILDRYSVTNENVWSLATATLTLTWS